MLPFYRLTLSSIFSLLSLFVAAQDLVYRNYTIDDGLPSSEVYYCMQDADGYMWFATDHGVARYDGKTFEIYNTDNGLTDNVVFKIIQGPDKKIWFLTYRHGLCYFENGQISTHPLNKEIIARFYTNYNRIRDFSIDHKNIMYIIEYNTHNNIKDSIGYFYIQNNQIKFVNPLLNDNYFSHYFFFLENKTTENFYGLVSNYQDARSSFSPVVSKINSHIIIKHFSCDGVINFCKVNNKYLLTYSNYVSVIDSQTLNIEKTIKIKYPVNCIKYYKNKCYIGTEYGLYIVNINEINSRTIESYIYLKQNYISSLTIDHEGNLWVSSINKGIIRIINQQIINYTNNITKEYSILSAKYFKNKLWFTTDKPSINFINDKEKIIELKSWPKDAPTSVKNMSDIIEFNNYLLSSNLYTSTNENKKYWDFYRKYITTNHFFIKKMINISEDTLAVGLSSGFACLSPNSHKYNPIFHSSEINFSKNVTSLVFDKVNATLIIGSTDGLFSFNFRNKKLYELLGSNYPVTAISKHLGTIFVGTKSKGIIIYNLKSKKIIAILGNQSEIGTNIINNVFLDTAQLNIIIATYKGLFIYNAKTLRFLKKIDKSSGLESNDIKKVTSHFNDLYLITKNDIYCIKDYLAKKNNYQIPLFIEKIDLKNSTKKILSSNRGFFSSKENSLTIKIKTISLNNIRNIIKYNLFKDDKLIASSEELNTDILQLTNLGHGDYVLELKSINSFGCTSKTLTYYFTIDTPLTYKPLFIVCISILSCLFISIVIISIYYAVKRNRQKNLSVLLSEQKALRAQMNPHFLFNALNSIQYYVARRDSESGANFLAKFSRLVRSILENSSRGWISLQEEMHNINLYLELEKLRFEDDFKVEVKTDLHSDPNSIEIPSMIIQPFIENSLWHGLLPKEGEKSIVVSLKEETNILECKISDNGIGRQASRNRNAEQRKSHQSQGMDNISERIRLFNAAFRTNMTIEVNDLYEGDSSISSGTEVILRIPIFEIGTRS